MWRSFPGPGKRGPARSQRPATRWIESGKGNGESPGPRGYASHARGDSGAMKESAPKTVPSRSRGDVSVIAAGTLPAVGAKAGLLAWEWRSDPSRLAAPLA